MVGVRLGMLPVEYSFSFKSSFVSVNFQDDHTVEVNQATHSFRDIASFDISGVYIYIYICVCVYVVI